MENSEWFLLDGQEGRFYTKQRKPVAAPPYAMCVNAQGELVAEMRTNMSGGITFSTHIPLSDTDAVKIFSILKREVPK